MDIARPALTPEQWENPADSLDGYVDLERGIVDVRLGGEAGARDAAQERKALVALLLRGQPFGSGWDDADERRRIIRDADLSQRFGEDDCPVVDTDAPRRLADRIEALLPPRTSPARVGI